jgi:hypothetical protein
VETQHRLVEGVQQDATTWRYVYSDNSPPNGLALVQHAAVEDTHGIDRATGAVIERHVETKEVRQGTGELLIGTKDCARRDADVMVQDRPDGRVSLWVDAPARGLVFLSEPYYVERRAFVDGSPVTPLKTNLAFTAVRVPPGRHFVELRHVPRSLHLGLLFSALTLVVWCGLVLKQK